LSDMWRQGDVVIRKIGDNIPTNFKYATHIHREDGFKVEGERSGHNHLMSNVDVYTGLEDSAYGLRSGTNAQMLVLEEPNTLRHPEHRELELPRGVYITYRVRDNIGRMGD